MEIVFHSQFNFILLQGRNASVGAETENSLRSIHTLLKRSFITDISIIFCCSLMHHTTPQIHFVAEPQCSSRCRDGNTCTTTHRSADAVEYERSFTEVYDRSFTAEYERTFILMATYSAEIHKTLLNLVGN